MKTQISWTDIAKPEDLSIAYFWTIFAGAVLPAGASALQREEMRKAFFAGFVECFKFTSDIASALPEAEACKVLDRVHKEANVFFEQMMKEIRR